MDIGIFPLVPIPVVAGLAALAAVALGVALWRGLTGAWLRAMAAVAVLAALIGPVLRDADRRALEDVFVVLVDGTASQDLPGRADQSARALAHLNAALAARGSLVTVPVADDPADGGTRLFQALSDALSAQPRGRIAGIFAITDGVVHDPAAAPDLPAPMHVLLTGASGDWDRRLTLLSAPTYGITGEDVPLSFRIDDLGDAPAASGPVDLLIAVDGAAPRRFTLPVGQDVTLPYPLPHGGENLLSIETPAVPGELTARNNAALVRITGVRDRLRVLLISGEPHPGERTWRNLLKADPAVDLVHFTILRPADKQDGVPAEELSLIAFPTQELFIDKIDEFDLIVFDRYRRRDILPPAHFESMRDYVEGGGAILVAAGPSYAGVDSIYRSALRDVLPGEPTARVLEQSYRPALSDLGQRHPVTRDLPGAETWGSWLRLIELRARRGDVVMEGPDGQPLLILDRVGEGRVALLASDHAWLWDRGYEGGGPQAELLRRLAHWLMKEPQLDEETLTAQVEGSELRVERRTLGDAPDSLRVTAPDGSEQVYPLTAAQPGAFTAQVPVGEAGIYRLHVGDTEAVVGVGPPAPREMIDTIASGARMAPHLAGGGVFRIEEGLPRLRDVRAGRVAHGAQWAGVTPRDASVLRDLRLIPLVPGWAWLLLAAGLMVLAWLRESRR